MARPASDARDRALAAAFAIVVRDGAASLTIGAVAEESGLSKGGVLHHFPTKDALVLALVESLVASHAERHQVRHGDSVRQADHLPLRRGLLRQLVRLAHVLRVLDLALHLQVAEH